MYRRLADEMARPGMKETFLEFAAEEDRHKERLEKVKAGDLPAVSDEKVQDLKIADYAIPAPVSPKMTYPEALRLAMQAEKSVNGGHWANMKNAGYKSVGIGVATRGGRTTVVYDFYGKRVY